MSFVSLEYMLFFAVVVPLYFVLGHRFRWLFLLAVSYFFYAYWNAWYVLIIIFTTVVDYFVARAIARSPVPARRKLYLGLSLTLNLGVLFVFKYFNFAVDSLNTVFSANIQAIDVLLPVGISFYTFQTMSYTIDVYRGHINPENNFGIFSTFVIFFPQLVAGPIERAGNMLHQFRQVMRFDEARTVEGLRLILWGFFKKVVIADRLAVYVNAVYGDVHSHSGPLLILATIFFAFQIYCDFSAYTDIAIGTAKIMGFTLMENFRQPYFSRSVREFWRRWHISLSTWFRDYLYIPLGGSRVPFGRALLNLLIVFVVSGLWHGAAWTFVIWGALHGLYVVAETLWQARGLRLLPQSWAGNEVRIAFTFALVTFAWIFFRANSLEDALYIVSHLFDFSTLTAVASLTAPFEGLFFSPQNELLIALLLIAGLILVDWLEGRWGINTALNRLYAIPRWGIYYALTISILLLGVWGTQQFIYFQF